MPAHPGTRLSRINAVCDAFEDQWQSGGRPRLESFLQGWDGPERAELFRFLVALDYDYCSRLGAPATAEDYQQQFPEYAWLVQEVLQAATKLPQQVGGGATARDLPPSEQATEDSFSAVVRPITANLRLEDFRITRQVQASEDGINYRANRKADELEVDLCVLTRLESDAERFQKVASRVRLAAMLRQQAVAKVIGHDLKATPALVVLEPLGADSLYDLHSEISADLGRSLALAKDITAALAEAHRLGLAHGSLGPGEIRFTPGGRVQIDFSGLRIGPSHSNGMDLLFRSSEGPNTSFADGVSSDVFAAGCLLIWLFTGEIPQAGQTQDCGQRLRAWSSQLHLPSDALATLTEALATSVAADPELRPFTDHLDDAVARVANFVSETLNELPGNWETTPDHRITAQVKRPAAGPETEMHDRDRPGRGQLASQALASQGLSQGQELGRFRILEKLGQGGMGAVYKAEDLADGTTIAIKVMQPSLASNAYALQRFRKEARLLAHANNPHIANLIEVNNDADLHYIVMEYVEGTDLERYLAKHAPLEERVAVGVAADVARALTSVHQRGIVHRDIKPANVLLVPSTQPQGSDDHQPASDFQGNQPRIKLTDFGLARHVDQSTSLELTKTGFMLGTPRYMAPEQIQAEGQITPATDVYSLGITLFQMLTGRLPFEGDTLMEVVKGHCSDPVPELRRIQPQTSEEVERIVNRALAKHPEQRYEDAAHLLDDLDRLLRGEPSSIAVHPVLPPHDPRTLFRADFSWELDSEPEKLWAYVSNTERINCAVGVPSVQYSTQRDREGVHKFGQFRLAGLNITWEELPFEWIEGQRLGVLRIFSRGPFKWFLSIVETLPRPGGGTTLKHRVRIEPRGFIGKLVAKLEVDIKGRPALQRVYQRIDAALSGKLGDARGVDPYVAPDALPRARRTRLEQRLRKLADQGLGPDVVERLGQFLAEAPSQELARIRPIVLARSLRLPEQELVDACLHAVKVGLLVLHWDILCPTCRIPSDFRETLRQISEHAYCEVCDLDFELDFGRSLELVFRAHPEIRQADAGTYCIGGPEHSPHVVAQLRFEPGETMELNLRLAEGAYLLRGPQVPYTVRFQVQPVVGSSRGHFELTRVLDERTLPVFRAGRQSITITNGLEQRILLRLERTLSFDDVLTAAQASANALFRELFPLESLRADQLMNVATVTLLSVAAGDADELYARLGDARAFESLQQLQQTVAAVVGQNGGAVFEADDRHSLAAFESPIAAVRTALRLAAAVATEGSPEPDPGLRMGVHTGTALVATAPRGVAYYGRSVSLTRRLLELAQRGQCLLTDAISGDPQVAALLNEKGLVGEVFPLEISGRREGLAIRLHLPASDSTTTS